VSAPEPWRRRPTLSAILRQTLAPLRLPACATSDRSRPRMAGRVRRARAKDAPRSSHCERRRADLWIAVGGHPELPKIVLESRTYGYLFSGVMQPPCLRASGTVRAAAKSRQ
jgi:hypothetical protein